MRHLLYIFICLFCFHITKAGNLPLDKAKVDFKKLNLVYLSTPSYSMNIQYLVFDSHIGGNLIENKLGTYIKHKESSYTKMLNTETIVTKKSTVVANNDDHFIVITDTRHIELSPIQTNMDSLLKMCETIKVSDIGTTKRHYVLDFGEEGEMSRIDIDINLSTFALDKLVIYYNEAMPMNPSNFYAEDKKPRLEIVYQSFKILSSVNEAIFTEATYLKPKGDTYTGTNHYSNYKVINQLNSFRFKKRK